MYQGNIIEIQLTSDKHLCVCVCVCVCVTFGECTSVKSDCIMGKGVNYIFRHATKWLTPDIVHLCHFYNLLNIVYHE